MRSKKLLTAILVLLATASAAVSIISLSTVGTADHAEPSLSITPTRVADQKEYIFELTVTHQGGDPIENVKIELPYTFTGLASIVKVPEDNLVTLQPGSENVVTLKAGTLIQLGTGTTIRAPENTPVIIPSGTEIVVRPETDNAPATLTENLLAKIAVSCFIDNATGLENVQTTADIMITVDNGTSRLLADVQAVRVTATVVRLVSDVTVELATSTSASLGADNEVSLDVEKTIGVDTVDYTTDNTGDIFTATASANTDTIYVVGSGDNVLVHAPSTSVVLPVGAVLTLQAADTVTLFENTDVVRAEGENLTMLTPADAENVPANWSFGDNTATTGYWTADNADYDLEAGSLIIPFAATTSAAGGYKDFIITTKDNTTVGQYIRTVVLEDVVYVDNVAPYITSITISPDPAKLTTVTIEVVASETLAKLDNVYVQQSGIPGLPDNYDFTISMTSADNITWTGTYQVIENYDNTATVYVEGDDFEDLVGKIGADNSKTFWVDTIPPRAVAAPSDENRALISYTISLGAGSASDNGGLSPADNTLTIEILRDNEVIRITTSTTAGEISTAITLEEGPNALSIRAKDAAGNVGPENSWSVFLDTTDPEITGFIAEDVDNVEYPKFDGVYYSKDNQPYFEAIVRDVGLGVDWDVTWSVISITENVPAPVDPYTENAYVDNKLTWRLDGEAPDGSYWIAITATDNVGNTKTENLRFVVDTDTPDPPTDLPTAPARLLGIGAEDIFITASVEDYGTLKVYGGPEGTTLLDSVMDTDGNGRVSLTVTLTAGTHELYVSTTDRAGNESSLNYFASTTVDLTLPTITITAPEPDLKTTESSVKVRGTVSDDRATITEVKVEADGVSRTVSVTNGAFETSMPLREGLNQITVEASDGVNTGEARVFVTRTVTPWAIYAAVVAIIAVILAAIAVLRKR